MSYLGDDVARVIVIEGTYDFTDTEGTTTSTGCAPWGTASACQVAINQNDWCNNYEPDAPSVSVTYDNAGVLGITVGSNKSLVGKSGATIKGKGLRLVGSSNVILQNFAVTDINPKFVWGGDGITLDDTDLVWIDHVTVSFESTDSMIFLRLNALANHEKFRRPLKLAVSTLFLVQAPLGV